MTSKRTSVPTVDTPASSSAALEALVGDLPSGYRMVALDHLVPHPDNPRKDLGDLTELVDSIKAQGVRQNLLVVPDPGDPDRHMIVIGHRRAAAARLAGLTELPAVVDPTLTPAQQLELMLVENVQRSDLTVVEEADAYQGLLDLGLTKADLAKRTGVSKTTVAARLKLAAMPEAAKAKVGTGQASLEDAEALAEFEDDHEVHANLLTHLGTHDFRWKLQDARRIRERAKKVEAARVHLMAAGIPIHDRPVAGYSTVGPYRPDDAENYYNAIADVAEIPSDAIAVPDQYTPYFNIYRPSEAVHEAREVAWAQKEEERRAAETPEERAAREAEEAAHEARLLASQQLRDAVTIAATLRADFLRPLTTGKKKMTAAQEKAVLTWYLTWAPVWEEFLDVDNASIYLDISAPVALSDLDDGETFDETWHAGRTPAQVALALAAELPAGHMNHPYYAEQGWGGFQQVGSFYLLLEALGYEPSEWEREQLANGIADAAEAGDE